MNSRPDQLMDQLDELEDKLDQNLYRQLCSHCQSRCAEATRCTPHSRDGAPIVFCFSRIQVPPTCRGRRDFTRLHFKSNFLSAWFLQNLYEKSSLFSRWNTLVSMASLASRPRAHRFIGSAVLQLQFCTSTVRQFLPFCSCCYCSSSCSLELAATLVSTLRP